ncbi:tRNA-dihydrouridine synthase 3 [Termitomyces sp. Mi166|nr:tRNA-dihydrouridine synthase 3 [Termitomyces sp. Mi166\
MGSSKHVENYNEDDLPAYTPMPWYARSDSNPSVPNATSRSLKEIRDAIPSRLFVRDTVRGLMYLARDLLMAAAAWSLATYIDPFFNQAYITELLTPVGAEVARWAACWKISHHRHHSNHASMERDEVYVPKTRSDLGLKKEGHPDLDYDEILGDTPIYTLYMLVRQQVLAFPAYLLFNVSGQKTYPKWTNHFDPNSILFTKAQRNVVILSNIGIAFMVWAVSYGSSVWGASEVLKYYGIPWLEVSHWFIMITYLHHTDPVLPHYRGKEWNFQRGAAATVDRPVLGWQGRFFLHDVAHFHVIHHFFPKMPFYHGPEATEHLKAFIGDYYVSSDVPAFVALWNSYNGCQFVEDEGDVLFYRDRRGKAVRRPADKLRVNTKYEYLLPVNNIGGVPDDDAAEGTTKPARSDRNGDARDDSSSRDSRSGPTRGKLTKEQRKAQRGANKGRRFGKVRDELDLCWRVANGANCEYGADQFSHDIRAYLAAKQQDIRIPEISEISNAPTFAPDSIKLAKPHPEHPSINLNTVCPIFAETGECRYGFKCRFLGGHVQVGPSGNLTLVNDEEKKARTAVSSQELNFIGGDIQKQLRSKKYSFPISDACLREIQQQNDVETSSKPKTDGGSGAVVLTEPEQDMDIDTTASEKPTRAPASTTEESIEKRTGESSLASTSDTPDVPVRFAEKKRLHWSGKTYLAPLTTVGNLPFRQLCVKYGADITCGEMGLANSFLAGSKEEWSLVRRHPSEKIFGVQVAGNKPSTLVPTAEVIAKELAGNVDFVDLNCGCPIDLVFKSGSGSALLDAPGKLGKILIGMNKALGDIPVTVKLRTGVKDGKNTAHKTMPRAAVEWGASCITLHGRTRQQRYTRLADWDYVKECVEAVRSQEAEEDLPPIPIFGGGDCYSSQDYWSNIEKTGVDGVMLGRGALIKPWLFTEVKERREWDISARERLDLIKTYAEYGINHFGSDTAGVNTTRRYLCEALSFQYRYIPIGLLERLPARINDRAPAFRGRDELETLLASGNSSDWIKISEMFLGPAPESWTFTPKHKSNAVESQG